MGLLQRLKGARRISLPRLEINISIADPAPEEAGRYAYGTDGGLPPFCAEPPAAEAMPDATRRYIKANLLRGKANALAARLAFKRQEGRATRLDDFGRLYPALPRPRQIHLWQQDDAFAWRWVAGVGCTLIERLRAVPTGSRLGEVVSPPAHASALAAGRIYCVDLRAVARAKVLPGRVLVPSVVYLEQTASGALKPLAIELFLEGGQRIETPASPFWTWQMAKAAALSARNLVQQALAHLLETHLVPEVVCVALHRCLPEAHPLHRLLAPHLEHVIPINVAARTLLLGRDGLIDRSMASGAAGFVDLIEAAWADWSWPAHTFAGDLAARGFAMEPDGLDYPYRDDGARYHAVLRRYVEASLDAAGWAAPDPDLATFHRALVEEGGLRDLPALADRDAVVAFAVEVIVKATGQHHAMQFNQYAEYGFPPGTAAALYRPIPLEGRLTEADFVAALPPVEAAAAQIEAAHVLERPTVESMMQFAQRMADTGQQRPIHEALYAELDALAKGIDVANLARLAPFEGMNPRVMPARVEI